MNSRWILFAGPMLLLSSGIAAAQQPTDHRDVSAAVGPTAISQSEVKPTPEMWLYLQERERHDSPKLALRRRAELEAAQRAERIAAMHWLRQSAQRPNAFNTPFGGFYPETFPYAGADPWNFYLSARGAGAQPSLR